MTERTEQAQTWISETAEQIAIRHMISPRTVRGWLSTGKVSEAMAENLAAIADQGVDSDMLNAMVYALAEGRPIGDLADLGVEGDE